MRHQLIIKFLALILAAALGLPNCYCQNLIQNSGFENFSLCPTDEGQLAFASFWHSPNDEGTPDLFDSCTSNPVIDIPDNWWGTQHPYDGNTYAGIHLMHCCYGFSVREYAENELSTPLAADVCYHFEMRISLGDSSRYATGDIGIYFSNTLITGIPGIAVLPFTPQILNASANVFSDSSWTIVSGDYIAQGGEQYVTIGNFFDHATTTMILRDSTRTNRIYVYLDEVSLVPCVPSSSIQPIVTKICPDSCISFTNQSSNATSYEWFFPAANPSYSTDENPTNICYYAPGYYDVTLIAHNGTYSDTTVSTNLIQVYAPPSPIVVQSNDSLLIMNVTGSNAYQWFYNGTIISGATNPFYIPTQNGNYSVNVTSAEGCSGENDLSVIIDNVDNAIASNGFELYPNPTSESFTVTTSHQGVSKLSIYNTLGQLVSIGLVDHGQRMEVSNLPAGIYHVTVEVDGEFYSQRLLISRP